MNDKFALIIIVTSLITASALASDVPFYVRSIDNSRDVSSLNENFRSIVNDITKLREDVDATNTSVSASASGYAVLTATQTFSGTNNFTGSVVMSSMMSVSNNANLTLGNPATGGLLGMNGISYYAKSVDGATQSSGCVVIAQLDRADNGPTSALVFTSTNVAAGEMRGTMPGVLLETCAPGQVCKVGVQGIYRIFNDATAPITNLACARTSTTRCAVTYADCTAPQNTLATPIPIDGGSVGTNSFGWFVFPAWRPR